MAQDKNQIKATYPLPAYNYRVTVMRDGASQVLSFSEVSGLSVEYEPVTYKHGLSFWMGVKIIPGMRQPTKLTLKRGVAKGSDFLYRWLDLTYTDPFKTAQRDILIDLCDESGGVVIRWTVHSALPVKLDGPTFDANTNEVAIETMELVAHDVQVDFNP